MTQIRLSSRQSQAWHYLHDRETTEVLFGGAAGPGKSFFGCIWHIDQRIRYPGTRGLIGRAKLKTLEESTLVTFYDACSAMGLVQGRDYIYNGQRNTIKWANGSKTILKDLQYYPSDPDYTSLGSTEYTDAFIDEATEIRLKAFEIISTRIRYKHQQYNLKPKILLACNPGPGWVKERYVVKNDQKVKLLSYQKFVPSLLTDNPDPAFRELYKLQLERLTNDYDRQRLLFGDWDAVPEPKSPFCRQYNRGLHESRSAVYNPGIPVIVMFDFNLDPFAVNFVHAWEDKAGRHVHVFDEMSIPSGSIPEVCDRIREIYGPSLAGCVVSGDASAKKRDISQRDNSSHYQQIKANLGLAPLQFRVPQHNPTHQNSRQDVNYFLKHFPDFKIHPDACKDTCRDMRTVECDEFDQIIKKNRSDLTQQADHLDCIRYLINTFFKDWIRTHQLWVSRSNVADLQRR